MANRKEAATLMVVGALTLLVAGTGLYLGFRTPTGPRAGTPVPKQPDQGPILFEMRSVRSEPDRVRLEWKEIPRARGYRVTVMTAADESLFTSPVLSTTAWTIPPDLRTRLAKATVYHWKIEADLPDGHPKISEPGAFATQ